MIKGTVKFFNNAKGFGFISPDDGGKDVFVPAATITQSGTPRLKAGQRVSFETEPDPKGPKAVRLTLLDEAPREMPREAPRESPREIAREMPRDAARESPAPRQAALTLYHDPASDDADEVLDALRDAGHEVRLVDVVLTPPTRDELKRLSLLLREVDQSLVRRYHPLFHGLQLDDRFISESEFWQGIAEHPQLINGPVIASAGKARLVRSAQDVKSFLGEDGAPSAKPKGLSSRLAAMMNGHPVPPKPPEVKKQPEEPIVRKVEKTEAPAAVIKLEPKTAKSAAAKPVAKPAAKAVKKVAAKPAEKTVKKAAPAKKVAKKK
jgi:CspA family cold shock protein